MARRAWRAASVRVDVRAEQLARQVAVLEGLADLPGRVAAIRPHFLSALAPMQHPQLSLERVGSAFDGGYVLPRTLLDSAAGVVSIGVGHNNEVDVELAKRGLRVHAWDHTVKGLPRKHDLITFHPIGVGPAAAPNLATLDSITDASFGGRDSNLVLLMDAEGAEWEVFATCSNETLDRFSILSLELHSLGDVLIPGGMTLEALTRLRERFIPVAVHANNHGAAWVSGGFVLPDVLEVTYVRSDLIPEGSYHGNCSAGLLTPCCPDVPELNLDWPDG